MQALEGAGQARLQRWPLQEGERVRLERKKGRTTQDGAVHEESQRVGLERGQPLL